MKGKSLADSSKYALFIKDRDKSLDAFLFKQKQRLSQLMTGAFIQLENNIRKFWGDDTFSYRSKYSNKYIVSELSHYLNRITHQVLNLYGQSIRIGYIIAFTGEKEALARAGVKPSSGGGLVPVSQAQKLVSEPGSDGVLLSDRLELVFRTLASKVELELERCRITKCNLQETLDRIQRVLPKKESYKRPPREIRDPRMQTREADEDPAWARSQVSIRQIPESEWSDIVDQYKLEFIPKWRSADTVFDIPYEGEDLQEIYGWEIEKDLTDRFVSSVREGQVDAANDQGIKDFVWISILDDKTDECCIWRHSLTTSEIKDKLEAGHDEECDAVVPPAHFNCRCSLAPVIDELPELEPSNAPEFDEWLNA